MPDSRVSNSTELAALQSIVEALQNVQPESRARLLRSAAVFFELGDTDTTHERSRDQVSSGSTSTTPERSLYVANQDMTPKEFLLYKRPPNNIVRVAVLAFYLTHYRDTPLFKTLDISKLNAEAAQPKFSNAAYAMADAVKQGYLLSATKGLRQLSAAGEQYVNALPDVDAAKAALASARPGRRTSKRPKSRTTTTKRVSKSPPPKSD